MEPKHFQSGSALYRIQMLTFLICILAVGDLGRGDYFDFPCLYPNIYMLMNPVNIFNDSNVFCQDHENIHTGIEKILKWTCDFKNPYIDRAKDFIRDFCGSDLDFRQKFEKTAICVQETGRIGLKTCLPEDSILHSINPCYTEKEAEELCTKFSDSFFSCFLNVFEKCGQEALCIVKRLIDVDKHFNMQSCLTKNDASCRFCQRLGGVCPDVIVPDVIPTKYNETVCESSPGTKSILPYAWAKVVFHTKTSIYLLQHFHKRYQIFVNILPNIPLLLKD